MPLFATLMGSLFNGLFAIFWRFMSAQAALRAASLAGFMVFMLALYEAAKQCHDNVCGPIIAAASAIHPMVGAGFGLIWNSKTFGIFSCYMTVWMLCEVYTHRKLMFETIMAGK